MKRDDYKQLNQDAYSKSSESFQKLEKISSYLVYRDVQSLLLKHLCKRIVGQSINILDIGCSIGTSILYFSEAIKNCGYTPNITGIDLNEDTLRTASKRFPEFRFKKVLEEDSLEDLGTFDLIICNFVLVEMQSCQMHAFLSKIRKLLSLRGIMFVTNPTVDVYHPKNTWYGINNQFPTNFPVSLESCKQTYSEDQKITLQVIDPKTREEIVTFYDFLHSQTAYHRAYKQAGLRLLQQHFPLGTAEDNIPWCSEKQKPRLRIDILCLN